MNLPQLFRLRLVIAALGETDRLGWWNSGVLSEMGAYLFSQGFPRSTQFAQTRVTFRIAQTACDEALSIQSTPSGPLVCHLFRLPPAVEDAFETERSRWMDQPELWQPLFASVLTLTPEQWPQALVELAELPPQWLSWASQQSPQTPKTLQLPDATSLEPEHLFQLAAGFAAGSPTQLVVPYLQVQA